MDNLYRRYIYLTITLLALQGQDSASDTGHYKTWIPNTNWDNDQNWSSGKVPCQMQDVELGNPLTNSQLAVALTGQNTLKSLSLPMNGELIFSKDAELTFFQDKEVLLDKNCKEKDKIQFIASAQKMWYNPNNWHVTDVNGNPVLNEANDVLHMEKVPCQHDQVLFPEDSSFNVGSTEPITVASVTINGKTYSQSSFKEFLNSESGAIQFHLNKASVQLTGKTCTDPKGCVCNTIEEKNTICGHVTCSQPQCGNPLEPTGSCCTYCGALMMVKPGASFTLDKFKTKIMSLTSKTRTVVQVSISRVSDMIQVVLTDSAKGEQAQSLAKQVTDQASGSSDFAIIKLSQSGEASHSEARKDDSKTSLGLPLGLGIGLLLLVILVIAFFIWRRKTRSNDSARRRFRTGTEERMRSHSLQLMQQNQIEMEEKPSDAGRQGTGEHVSADIKYQNLESDILLYESGVKKTFENPLYEGTSDENLTRVV